MKQCNWLWVRVWERPNLCLQREQRRLNRSPSCLCEAGEDWARLKTTRGAHPRFYTSVLLEISPWLLEKPRQAGEANREPVPRERARCPKCICSSKRVGGRGLGTAFSSAAPRDVKVSSGRVRFGVILEGKVLV